MKDSQEEIKEVQQPSESNAQAAVEASESQIENDQQQTLELLQARTAEEPYASVPPNDLKLETGPATEGQELREPLAVDSKQDDIVSEPRHDEDLEQPDTGDKQDIAQKTLYSVTDGRTTQEMGETTKVVGKMSRSQLEQRSIMQLQQEKDKSSALDQQPERKLIVLSQAEEYEASPTEENDQVAKTTVRQQTFTSNLNVNTQNQSPGLRGATQRPMVSLGQPRNSAFDGSELTITATQKDYSPRPGPRGSLSRSPTIPQKDTKKKPNPQQNLQLKSYLEQVKESATGTVPQTVETVLMSNDRPILEQHAHHQPRLQGVPVVNSGSVHVGLTQNNHNNSNEQIPRMRPDKQAFVQRSDQDLNRMPEIYTMNQRGPNESSDLDLVNVQHFNQYLVDAKQRTLEDDSKQTLNRHQESQYENISNSNHHNAIWPEIMKPTDIMTQNRRIDRFNTIAHGDSLMETPDRMLNSIMQSEKQRQNSVRLPGSANKMQEPKVSLRAIKAQAEHEKLIEEVRANHFKQVQQVLGPLFSNKVTSNTIEGTEDQMRKRIITNSYSIKRKQMRSISPNLLRQQAGGMAVRTQRPPRLQDKSIVGQEHTTAQEDSNNMSNVISAPIQPKSQVRVPRDLLMMAIAKKQGEITTRNKDLMAHTARNNHQDSLLQSTHLERSYLPNQSPLHLPQIGPRTTRNEQSISINLPGTQLEEQKKNSYFDMTDASQGINHTRNSVIYQKHGDKKGMHHHLASDYQSIQHKNRQLGSQDFLYQDVSIFGGAKANESTVDASGENQLTSGGDDFMNRTAKSQNLGQALSFHITDLLEQSIAVPRESNNIKATIDFYKRSVKHETELNMKKEIIIKNYRLRIVDANVDLTERDRRIMKLNKGTSIYVANSLIKPEIYRYSTKVTNLITEIFPFMRDEEPQQHLILSAHDMESLTYEDQVEAENLLFEKYGSRADFHQPGMEAIQEEEEIQRKNEQRVINMATDKKDVMPPMSAAMQARASNKILVHQDESKPSLADDKDQAVNNQQEFTPTDGIIIPNAMRRSQATRHSQHTNMRGSMQGQEQRIASSIESYVSPKSIGTNITQHFEQDELRAVKQTDHLFEKWVRNIKTAYTDPIPDRHNPINSFGVELPPPIKDINFKLMQAEGKDVILKEKQLPVERLTAVTLMDEKPYLHLMLSVTNPEIRAFTLDFLFKTIKYCEQMPNLPSHFLSGIQNMSARAARRSIKFMREQFTHLDTQIIQDGNLHPDLYLHERYVEELVQALKDQKSDDSLPVIKGTIDYQFKGKPKERLPIEVTDYDDEFSSFLCVNEEKNVHTMRPRIYIELDGEQDNELKELMNLAVKMRAESFQYLRVARLIQNELLKRYGHIVLTEDTRDKIYARIGLDLTRNRRRTVMKVIIQVEALYVFAVLRSTLSSQRDDPFIKNMLLNFKVAFDSPALEIEKQRYKEKKDLVGIKAFKMSAVKQDLDKNSGFLTNENFIGLPGRNKKLTEDAVGDSKLFQAPFDVYELIANNFKAYKGINIEDLKGKINVYPLTHVDWVTAQGQISKHFQSLIKDKWAQTLAHSVWETLQAEFEFTISKPMTEDDLDPQIYKIFNQIKQFQQNMIYRSFESGLKDYLRFLLGFAMRNDDIMNSDILHTIAHQRFINLVDETKNEIEEVPDGEITNDLRLVPRQWGPMIKLNFVLVEQGKSRLKKKMKIQSQPDYEDIAKDMFSVVISMHNSLKGIKRVESVVFPLLELKNEFLQRPEFAHNAVLLNITKMIQKLINECTKYVKATLKNCNKYVDEIFSKKPDSIILELKKQSFALENQGEEGSEAGANKEEGKEAGKEDGSAPATADGEASKAPDTATAAQQAADKPTEGTQLTVEDDETEESDSDEEGGGSYQQNNQAFKSVDIDQSLMRGEIIKIRVHKWQTLENVHDFYDFGLLQLDCKPLKTEIIDHCDLLLTHLEKYIRNEFLDKMRNVKSEISQVEGRLNDTAESIDEVISLLEYIDTLKRTDNKVAEIQEYIDVMQRSMIFIDSVQIMFSDENYQEFLNIRNWPRSFNKWIYVRKEQLLEQKNKLIKEMEEETNNVFKKMLEFKLQIKEVLQKGLVKLTVEEREDRVKSINDMFEGLGPNNTPKPNSADSDRKKKKEKEKEKAPVPQYEIPMFICFEWLAQESGWTKKKFDVDLIDKTFQQTEELKTTFDNVSMLTIQINKREALLGVPKTSFVELKKIQDDLKPLYELWAVASRYCNQIPTWLEGQFEGIESGDLEQMIEEWLIELKRLQKTHLIETHKRQAELLEFMFETLAYFKKYYPMIKTLRSKGLALRHWRTIGQQLGFSIDPANVSLFKILALGLDEEEKLKIIKNISDIAQKEYAVMSQLENLDREMKHVEFDFESAPDNETKLCRGIPDINSLFEEFNLRVNVLRTNPHMKNFFEKLYEIEKTVKSVIEILVDFSILQRNWLYLNGIFSRSEINKQLANEVKQFNNLDIIFKYTMKGLVAQPQVYKISHRDNFLSQLKKLNQDSDNIKQGLAVFLEQKRAYFPRLYFISNEELIDVYGKSEIIISDLIKGKPLAFLQNLFEGVDIVKVNASTRKIYAMCSKSGEIVPLTSEIATEHVSPEVWLKKFESVMQNSLRHEIFRSYYEMDMDLPQVPETQRDFNKFMATKASHERKVRGSYLRKWLKEWPSQCTYLAQQIWFTKKLVSIFESAADRKIKVAKDKKLKLLRMDSDDELSDNSDEYASVNLSDDENANPTTKMAILEAQQKIVDAGSGEEDNDEDEEDDDGNTKSNFNKTSGKLADEHEQRFIISLEDRILRNRDRYLVSTLKHPGYQIEDVKKTVIQKTLILSQMLKKKLEGFVRATVITFITILVYHRDYAIKLKRERVFKITDFGWQLYMKFDLLDIDKVIEDLRVQNNPDLDPFSEKVTDKLRPTASEVNFEVLQYNQEFGYEYLGNQQRLVITPLTERCQRSLLVALQYNYGGAPEGPFGTGKTETTKDLGRHLAKQCYVQNSTGQIEYENILRFFKGIASAGAWLIFDEFNRLDPKILAFLSQIIIQIQNSIRKKVSVVHFDQDKNPLNFAAAVFITLNPGYAGRTELPMDLKNLFRSVSMVVPDAVFISEILLFSAGFKNAQELSKRICSVQGLANVLMQQASVVKFDFGLRAIKAIVAIAEQLKQQVLNIWESDLPDIVNEDAMDRVRWKHEHIIKDVQDELDPSPEAFIEQAEFKRQDRSPTEKRMDFAGDSNMASGRLASLGESMFSSEGITEELSSVFEDEGSQQKEESEKPEDQGLDQSDDSDDGMNKEPVKQQKMQGPLFKEIFLSAKDWKQRQKETIMLQIGVRPQQRLTEVELEDYIIVKAVKDYNTSKFSDDMLQSINGIISDVFLGSVPKLRSEGSNYGNLTELVFAAFQDHKLDYNRKMNQKAFQLYEIVQVKQGCIVLGDTQAGKTTLQQILATALNKAMGNELKIRISQERKNRLRAIAIQYFEEKKAEEENPTKVVKGKKSKKTGDDELGGMGDTGLNQKKPDKKKGKKNAAKSRMQLWQDLYKKSKLDKHEIDRLKEDLVQRGVRQVRVNPKSLKLNELFGEVNRETYIWSEGQFTEHFRRFSLDKSSAKKWILMDGPIDHYWVENLNSILDENRKMNLPNGETIQLSDGMCLLLETDSLRNCTPATISRCGLVFLARADVNKPKQIFNQYLQRLPPNMEAVVQDIENQTNWLMPECFRIFDNEKHRNALLMPGIDYHWIVQNYVKLLDCFFSGYWNDFIKQNVTPNEDGSINPLLAKVGQAYGVRRQDVIPEDEDAIQPNVIMDKFNQLRLQATMGLSYKGVGKRSDARLAHNDFQGQESRQENSLKYLPIWSEAFVITALTWAFAPVLKKDARRRLSDAMKERILGAKSDFGTYQKIKKKLAVDKAAAAEEKLNKQKPGAQNPGDQSGKSMQRQHSVANNQMMSHSGKNNKLIKQLTRRLSVDGFQEKTFAGLSSDFTDQSERPLFISDYPFEQDLTVFDCYFNLDTNQWTKFDLQKDMSRMLINYNEMVPSTRIIQNVTIPTQDSIRYNYIIELLLTAQKPVLVFGEGASGKSALIKDMVFNQMMQFAQSYFVEHITCSHYTDVSSIKSNIERSLVIKRQELSPETKEDLGNTVNSFQMEMLTDTGRLTPDGEKHKLIVFLEDLHMAKTDKYNDLPGLEVLRDLLTTSEWYSSAYKSHRVIDETNLIACINCQSEQILRTPPRLLFKFALIGMEGFDEMTSVHIMSNLFEIQSQEWPSAISTLIPRLAQAIDSLYQHCFNNMKPTPLKVHYAFNYRECFKFVTAFCKVEGNYLKSEAQLVKLFYHESIRQYADKILMRHDLTWFKETLVKLIWEHFDLMPNKELEVKTTTNENGEPVDDVEEVKLPQESDRNAGTASVPNQSQQQISQPTMPGQAPQTVPGTHVTDKNDPMYRQWPIDDEDNLWFSIMNMDVEGYYCEIKPPEGRYDEPIEKLIHEKIEGFLIKYNEQPDKAKMTLTLYREFNRHLLKIIRAVTVHDGHVIIVGMKGFGISMMTRLACFSAGITFNKMELHPNFVEEEWRADLRKNIIQSASEDKQLAYICDEYRILHDSWYKDLETLVKSNVCSEITRHHDVLASLVAIQTQLKKSQNALVGGKKGEEAKNPEEQVDELAYQKDMRNIVKKDANVRNKLYLNFLQRVRKNFHLIFNFTPSGYNFREKMDNHKQLMLNSQMIFIQNLQLEDLRQIGQKIFVEKYDEQIDKRARDPKTPEQEDLYNKDKEKALNPKVLDAVCRMYRATCDMGKRYHEEHGHILYFTPVFFIRTFREFTRLLEERKINVVEIQNRYNKGLEKLKVTMKEVKYYATKLREKTPIMQEKQRALVEIVVDIEEQYQKIRLQKERLMQEENECNASVQEATQLKDEAQDALDKIVPCVTAALNSMQQIQKYEVAQVKTLDHPPRTLKLVMKAICILLSVEPIVKKNSKGVYKPSYWKAAIGPDVLGDPRLPERLVNYDKSQLTEEMMAQVEDILGEADYTYENAHRAFKAASGLFRWVKAIRDYFYIFQDMQPRRDALTLAEKQLEERNKDLKAKKSEIRELQSNLDGLEVHQKSKQKLIDELKEKIDSTILRKRRADTLMKGLNAEQQKWVVCTRMLNSKYDTVQGDVLLAAGYITMAGGFTQQYRLDLVISWQKCLHQAELTYSEIFGFQELFGDNFKIREWHSNQLPPDTFSTDNGLIINKTKRYRLIIDPQQLAWIWLRRQHSAQGIISTKMNDPGFKRTLEIAIDLGKIVLIENLNEKVDVHIESLVRREITKYGNQKMLKFCRRPLKYDPAFDLYILTNLSKPHYDCNITNHVCQINFFVTVEGMTQNLLSMIVANERPDLEESFNENSKATFENVRLLKETENKILKNLSPNVKDLLNNDKLIEVLKESKVCAETVAEKLKKINNTNQFLQKTRLMYAPVAVRAANLYFAVTELFQVNKMYQFSMKWFFNVFNQTLAKANALNESKEVTIDDEDFKLLNHKFTADDRIQLLIKSFTQELIRKTIFSCFQDDRQLVTYFICIKVLLAEELLDSELLTFSMTGSKKIRQDAISPGPSIGIHWMNDVIWAELDALSNIKPFNKDNLQEHIKENPAVWNQLFDHKHVAFTDLPNRNLIDLSDFFEKEPVMPSTGTKKVKVKGSQKLTSVMQSKETGKDDSEVKKKLAKLALPPTKPQTKQQQSQGQIIKDSQFKEDMGAVLKSEANIGNILEAQSLKSMTEASKKDLNEDSEQNDEQIVDRNTESRASSKRQEDDDKVWTVDEILADSELWQVTDDSDEDEESEEVVEESKQGVAAAESSLQKQSTFKDPASAGLASTGKNGAGSSLKKDPFGQQEKQSPKKQSKYNAYERNKDYYDDSQLLEDEQEQMARYLVDKAPGQNSFGFKDRFTDMQRKTKTERKAIMLREFIVKNQCELAMQRCIRPDLMQQALHKIVGTVYDFNYTSFELDVLAKFIDPDGTLAWRRHKMSQGLQTGRNDGSGKNNPQVYLAPARKSTENNIQLLIKEAFEESIPASPIFFLVTHSINVFNELQLFYQKRIAGHQVTKLLHFQVGKGLNKTIEEAIAKAAAAGDWILIENLQLADEWIDELELIIAKLPEEISSNKFRLFLSSVHMENCPHMILKQSVKVALQQPTGIKLRMERFIDEFSKSQEWRRGPNYVMHKNMYFALAYLHSVLDGRKMFGPLGWNIYSGFDASDFSISEQQLISYLGQSVQDKETQVRMLKYLYANVNFSGKISREEDLRKLNAVIEDLIVPEIAMCVRALPDMNKGHYGFPRYDDEFVEWVESQLPKQDPSEVYGFNRNSERYVLKVKAFDIMSRLYHLNRTMVAKQSMGYQDLQYDLENQSIRISLAKSSLHTQSAQNTLIQNMGDRFPGLYQDNSMSLMDDRHSSKALLNKSHSASQYFNQTAIEDQSADALLPLFVKMQKLLRKSSLDTDIKTDCDRFDEKIDQKELPMRDIYDRKVSKTARQLTKVLSNMLSERVVAMKLPYNHKNAIANVFALEVRQFIALIKAIADDVGNLMEHIDGKYMKPLEIEKLWSQIQGNVIPNSWRKFSFQTAYISLADFVIELVEKVKFWQGLLRVNSQVPSVWVPGFFDPSQYLNALRQKKSRAEDIPARMIKNTYHIMDFTDATAENCPAETNVAYIHGLWLEGASWDRENRIIVEQTNSQIYDKFPVIKVVTELMSQEEQDALDGTLDDFDDNPELSKKDIVEKEENDQKIKEQMEREDKIRSQLRNDNKSKLQQEKDKQTNKGGGAMSRMNSRMSSKQSLNRGVGGGSQSGRDSQYNFKRAESKHSRQSDSDMDDDKMSRKSSRSKMSKMSRQKSIKDNESTMSRKTKKDKKVVIQPPSGLSKIGQQEFAEDSREDDESSEISSDEEAKARKWAENLYTYTCPVFRTTLRLRTGEISSDNKPVFYIKLPSLTHPRKWVKRSVALLMETYR